jgi:Uma2 family endonuclease
MRMLRREVGKDITDMTIKKEEVVMIDHIIREVTIQVIEVEEEVDLVIEVVSEEEAFKKNKFLTSTLLMKTKQ